MKLLNRMNQHLLLSLVFLGMMACAQGATLQESPERYWDFEQLKQPPTFRDAPFEDSQAEGLRAILVMGYGTGEEKENFNAPQPKPLSAKKKAVFFAYLGFPSTPVPEGGFPGIVLIHGGGGTAYPEFTRHWINRGYAVIALDWYNQRPIPEKSDKGWSVKQREPLQGGKRQDHVSNIANMVLCHSLLLAQKNVNPAKTAFVGLSWGSWYGAIVAAIDPRFKGGVEIYCGDVSSRKNLVNGRFHQSAKVPLYWVAGTNDQNVTLETLKTGFEICPTRVNQSLVIRLPHSHVGFLFESCQRMAAHFTQGTPGLPKLGELTIQGDAVSASILEQGKGIQYAVLCYTDSTEKVTHKREWKSSPAEIKNGRVTATLPPGAHQFFLSAYDEKSRYNDLCGSTLPAILPIPQNTTEAP